MTIELGFAELDLGDVRFGVVDVPGHEKFVRTMVSGATAIDLALLVVAADDSVMPQTREHVEILSLLSVRAAVVALTKIDVVEPDLVELVADDVQELLRETPMREATIVPVSSVTGAGLDNLRRALVEAAGRIPERMSNPPFRMSIDRVFTVAGRGTVVTGSVLRGQVAVGDTLDVWPAGVTCKVRDLQTHGRHSDQIEMGQRAALNVIGADRDVLERGSDLAGPGFLSPSRIVDVGLTCLASCRNPIRSFSRVRLCIGTRELLVRVVPIDGAPIAPGRSGYAQLRSQEPIIAAYGQRLIVRDENASRTIGGGIILRCDARRWTADRQAEKAALDVLEHGDDEARVGEVLRSAGFDPVDPPALCARTGVELDRLPAVLAALDATGGRITLDTSSRRYSTAGVEAFLDRSLRWLARFHAGNPNVPGCLTDTFLGWLERRSTKGLGRPLLERLLAGGRVRPLGQYVCLPEFAPALSTQDERLLSAMVAEYLETAFQPPRIEELNIAQQVNRQRLQRLARVAAATGQLVRIQEDVYLHADRERELRNVVRALAAAGPGCTVSQIRERLNSSRKYVVPFVEYLDRIGFTRREGDLRFVDRNEHE